ncbi:hypothetical protein [Acanthamoeba polyphaga mimivirus]|uniref:Uncharacterized protein n=2 Tax=Mimivirus TaxID=315393 RepID=E3VYB1_MIMIV|nr:hypothetical protein MIMI_gp0930 [Acanthamoeba polyphaga mimivirus]ADO18436.1 hypothetical protein [Acanthamoeba polyphaga mimivirus]
MHETMSNSSFLISKLFDGSTIDTTLLTLVQKICDNANLNNVENISRIADTMDYVDNEMISFLTRSTSLEINGIHFEVEAIDLQLLYYKLSYKTISQVLYHKLSHETKFLPNVTALNQFIMDNLKTCEMFRERTWYTVYVSDTYGTLNWFNKNDLLFLIVLTTKFMSQ